MAIKELIAPFCTEMAKIAKVVTPLQAHQQRVVSRIQDPNQPGLVVAHGLGSGKTLTSIAAQDALNMPADVIVPASLRANYKKELKKHRKGGPKADVQSLQNVAVKGKVPQAPMMIVDEAHRLRDVGTKGYQTIRKATPKKRLLLTGSPLYNRPSDISPLVDIAAGRDVLPRDPAEFKAKYVQERKISPGIIARLRGIKPGTEAHLNPKRTQELQGILNKWVDYYEGSKENFPEVTREDVKVPMTDEQIKYYDTMMGKAPYWVRAKVRAGLPPSKSEAQRLNSFLGAVRQVSNTTAPFQSYGKPQDPKIQKAFQELKKELDSNPRAKAVVYSNFIQAGIDPYKGLLAAAQIPYGEFTGQMPKKKRDELVKDYNAGKIRALLLSSAGGEGLDLRGTRLMQVLEPHWNEEKLRQVEGRGVRFKSHADLPPEERKVRIQRFQSVRTPQGVLEKLKLRKPGMGVDEYLMRMSENKSRLNNEFRELLRNQERAQR